MKTKQIGDATLMNGDSLSVLRTIPSESVQCVVTSPPYYGLRDYGVDGQIGLEQSPFDYINKLVEIFREVYRVLRNDGVLWINIDDSYGGSGRGSGVSKEKKAKNKLQNKASYIESPKFVGGGIKAKDLMMIPARLAIALCDDGWYIRQEIIWAKSSCMPESVTDRCTNSHEYIFLLAKSRNYYFDNNAIKEPVKEVSKIRAKYGWSGNGDDGGGNYAGLEHCDEMGSRFCAEDGMRNKRSVWHIKPKPYSGAHFATFPEGLAEPCILAGSKVGDVILDPFNGAATTGVVALKAGRKYIGIELNHEYVEISQKRLNDVLKQSSLF